MFLTEEPKTDLSIFSIPDLEKKGLSKKTIDIIRTTQRNNIELTAIADNKANVLLSLNAILIAALFPLVLNNLELVFQRHFFLPLIIFSFTCFITICLAAKVLKPSSFKDTRNGASSEANPSPFFFGNFYQMNASEYYTYLEEGLSNPSRIKVHMAQDLFYTGKRLGYKMSWIRKAFNLFTTGIFLTVITFFLSLITS